MPGGPRTKAYEPNPALRALYGRFFDRIQVDEGWISDVRRLAATGTVVYILRNLNFIDFFALDHLTRRFGLPQIRVANDLGLWVLNPTGKGWLDAIFPNGASTPSDELSAALSDGSSAALFLKRPPGVLDVAAGASGGRGLREGDELIRTLLDLQRHSLMMVCLFSAVVMFRPWVTLPML
jgi:glycerol-3-phosphate O-acyltransferase